MRLLIVPGPVDKVHLTSCGHARRAEERGTTKRMQGARADRMLDALKGLDDDDFLTNDGKDGLPSGYFRPCMVCRPTEAERG